MLPLRVRVGAILALFAAVAALACATARANVGDTERRGVHGSGCLSAADRVAKRSAASGDAAIHRSTGRARRAGEGRDRDPDEQPLEPSQEAQTDGRTAARDGGKGHRTTDRRAYAAQHTGLICNPCHDTQIFAPETSLLMI